MPEVRLSLEEKIAGEITLSENPGETIKKWRKNFGISQAEVAEKIGVTPSMISDYESGRRKSPGTVFVGKIVRALMEIDRERGGKMIERYEESLRDSRLRDVIYDMREYRIPVPLSEFVRKINGDFVVDVGERMLNGHTIVHSIKAILKLTSPDFYKLYGWSTERAMIFTKVTTGRSPMIAVRVIDLKPGAIVLHGISRSKVDELAKKIAEIERIPLISTVMPLDELIKRLR